MVAILLFLAGLLSVILGVMVVVGQPRRLVSWLFFGIGSSAALWAVGVGVFLLAREPGMLLAAAQAYYVAAASIALFLLLTATALVGRSSGAVYTLIAIPAAALIATIITSPSTLLSSVTVADPNVATLNFQFYPTYIGYFVVYYILSLWYMYRWIRRNRRDRQRRAQLRMMMSAYVWAGVVGMIFNLFLPAIGNYSIIWAGPLCLFIFVPMVYLAIAKHQLFDLRLALVRSAAYVFSLGVLALVYFGLVFVLSVVLFKNVAPDTFGISTVNVVSALLLAFLFQPIKHFFDRLTGRIFYRDTYDADEFIAKLGAVLTSTTHLYEVLEQALEHITRTLKVSSGQFIVYRDHHDNAVVGRGDYSAFTEDECRVLHQLAETCGSGLLVVDAALRYDDLEVAKIHKLLAKRHVALVLPLVSARETIGYLLLGEQLGSGYAVKDRRVLTTIANELVIAIMNARSVQVVRDLNTHLEERVGFATRELTRSNQRLLELDATKDEFLSMASHQLRTPLTSIKGYISMVLEGDVGAITPAQRQLLEEAYTSSERMVHLIGDFLNVNRLQTGKFMIDAAQVDLSKVVRQEVDSIQQMAAGHDTVVQYKAPARFPLLYVDEGKIRQVVMNFIDNAIYYSPEGKVIKVTLSIEDGDAVLRVTDKGMGVPADVQKKLFTKFFRAENARKQRPDGTGIGLYLARKVIDGHGGKVVFESIEGKGSTFGFRLSIKKLSKPPKPKVVED